MRLKKIPSPVDVRYPLPISLLNDGKQSDRQLSHPLLQEPRSVSIEGQNLLGKECFSEFPGSNCTTERVFVFSNSVSGYYYAGAENLFLSATRGACTTESAGRTPEAHTQYIISVFFK